MTRKTKLTEEDRQEIVRLYESGSMDLHTVARKFHVNEPRIREILASNGVAIKKHRGWANLQGGRRKRS